ncbi:hypothetical protein SNEBB_008488 [Seison nebaliae]|nr:hypothetical protein SNEBB_008488 [Seison nebaliae]
MSETQHDDTITLLSTKNDLEELDETEFDYIVTERIENFIPIYETVEGKRIQGLLNGRVSIKFVEGSQYEGEYVRGMMNGTGVFEWKDHVKYEGTFSDGEITGEGTITWPNGSFYKGTVVDGWREGYGKLYLNGEIPYIYSGYWKKGKRHGIGKLTLRRLGHNIYYGEWINNRKSGLGVCTYQNGNRYEGEWINDVKHGYGRMFWDDVNEEYAGFWKNGQMSGEGHYVWYVKRTEVGSPYNLRNEYIGNFTNNERNGYGKFYYADGSTYEGNWSNGKKHGYGKFIRRNGDDYEGLFENNYIKDGSKYLENKMEFNVIKLRIDQILKYLPLFTHEEELKLTTNTVQRYLIPLQNVYNFYANLGKNKSRDNTYVLHRIQFWRFLLDCCLANAEFSIPEIDRKLYYTQEVNEESLKQIHDPFSKIIFREFVHHLIFLSYLIYGKRYSGDTPVLQWCLNKLINHHILRFATEPKGEIFTSPIKFGIFRKYYENCRRMFLALSKKRQHVPFDYTVTKRDLIMFFDSLDLINEKCKISSNLLVLFIEEATGFNVGITSEVISTIQDVDGPKSPQLSLKSQEVETSVAVASKKTSAASIFPPTELPNMNREICVLEFFEICLHVAYHYDCSLPGSQINLTES